MGVTHKDQYRIAVKYGVLKEHFSRNQFDLCPQKLLTINDVNTESMIFLREAVVRQSTSGGYKKKSNLPSVENNETFAN